MSLKATLTLIKKVAASTAKASTALVTAIVKEKFKKNP